MFTTQTKPLHKKPVYFYPMFMEPLKGKDIIRIQRGRG